MSGLDTKLTDLANAIRTKTGVTGPLSLDDMVVAIENYKNQVIASDTGFIQRDIVNFIVPDGITRLVGLYDCRALKSVVFSSSVTTIGSSCFSGCTAIESIVFPNTITTIEFGVIQGCRSLRSIKIPSSVTSINPYAFSLNSSHYSLSDIYCEFPEGAIPDAPWGAPESTIVHYNVVKEIEK